MISTRDILVFKIGCVMKSIIVKNVKKQTTFNPSLPPRSATYNVVNGVHHTKALGMRHF
jgi:hypothetical protein